MEPRQLALGLARARAINGIAMLLVPGLMTRPLFGKNDATARALLRLVGIRDLVLGLGAITTVKEHTMDAEWVGMGAVADVVDGLVTLGSPGLPKRTRLVSVIGSGAGALGLYAARALASERPSEIDS